MKTVRHFLWQSRGVLIAGAVLVVGAFSLLLRNSRPKKGNKRKVSQQKPMRRDDDLIEGRFISDYAQFALQMNFQAITALLEKARSSEDPIRRKSICLSGLQLLYSSYEDFAVLLHAFRNKKKGRHLHLTIGVEDQTRTGSTGMPRIFKNFESAKQMLDDFGFTSITFDLIVKYLDITEKEFEDHYRDIATAVKGLAEYQESMNIYKNKLKHGKPVLEGEGNRNNLVDHVLFLRWSDNAGKWELELHWVNASLEQLENAIKQVAKLYVRSVELLWLFMLHYYPSHADEFRNKMVKCSRECIDQVRSLGLESQGLT